MCALRHRPNAAAFGASRGAEKLLAADFRTLDDLRGLRPTELARELHVAPSEALAVLRAVTAAFTHPSARTAELEALDAGGEEGAVLAVERLSDPHAPVGTSALDLLSVEASGVPIVTFCEELDRLLEGGVPVGEVTEFCGAPGVGKSQLGMQLAVDAAIPATFGGAQGEAVYIDTEGSFAAERVAQIARAMVSHVRRVGGARSSRESDATAVAVASSLREEDVLNGIHVFRCVNVTEQLAVVETLPSFVDAHPLVKLVVLDSVSFHFRHGVEDMAQRSRQLHRMAQALHAVAGTKRLAVVVINQVTMRPGTSGVAAAGGSDMHLVPALGESWSHASTNRVSLYWEGATRWAALVKSPSRRCGKVQFEVTSDGVRGVRRGSGSGSGDGADDRPHAAKRARIEP